MGSALVLLAGSRRLMLWPRCVQGRLLVGAERTHHACPIHMRCRGCGGTTDVFNGTGSSQPLPGGAEPSSGTPHGASSSGGSSGTSTPKPLVFLSHAGKQKKDIVSCIEAIFESRGVAAFLDEHSLQAGHPNIPTIEAALRTAPVGECHQKT